MSIIQQTDILIIGAGPSGSSAAALFIFTDFIGLYYIYSNIISFILGLTVNYLLSKEYVFSEEVEINYILEFITCGLIGILGIGIDTFVLWIFTSKLGIYYMLSKIISTGITFIWNFSARKLLYVYLEKGDEDM